MRNLYICFAPVSLISYYMWSFICDLLHLLKCMGKLRRDQEEDLILAKRHCHHQGNVQKNTLVPLAKLLSYIQVSQLRNSWPCLSLLDCIQCVKFSVCIYRNTVFRFWKKIWGMFLLYTWALPQSWRTRANSCWSGWASSAELSRVTRVVTPRVSYYRY